MAVILAATLAAPYVAVALLVTRSDSESRRSARGVGAGMSALTRTIMLLALLAIPLAIVALLSESAVLFFPLFSLLAVGELPGGPGLMLLWCVSFFALQVGLARALRRVSDDMSDTLAVLAPVVVAVSAGLVVARLPRSSERGERPAAHADARAASASGSAGALSPVQARPPADYVPTTGPADADTYAATAILQRCAHDYARAHAGRFPPSLESAAEGDARCTTLLAPSGSAPRVAYRVTTRSGRVVGFVAIAPASTRQGPASLAYLTDERGITVAAPPTAARDSSGWPVSRASLRITTDIGARVLASAHCIENIGWDQDAHGYERAALLRQNSVETVCRLPESGIPGDVAGYVLSVSAAGDRRFTPTFTLDARPLAYPTSGVRSFRIIYRGRVAATHATGEDRAALASDPPMAPCERDPTTPCQLGH